MIDLVAHRGDMTQLPENTLLALENALSHGAPYIEFDLQMNRDGDFIVIHDDNCLRTAGIDCPILQSTTAELRQISVHEPEKYQQDFVPTFISTLDDTLQMLGKYPKAQAFVEIKEESLQFWGMKKVMTALLQKLANHHPNCILISFDVAAMAFAREHSTIRIGWVLKQYNENHLQMATQLEPDYLLCNYRKTPDVGELLSGGWKWLLYDITDPDLAISYYKRGVSLIETGDIINMLTEMSIARNNS